MIIFINQIISLGFITIILNFKIKLAIIIFLLFLFFLIGYFDDKKSISPLKKTVLIFLFILLPLEQSLIIKNSN